ncbi:MAG: isopropylmalate synthase [Candidatus Lokiarchaeota archaeon]|nr:isopropylmalate synthase [Candidatus Lokiarchaeota archaeon]
MATIQEAKIDDTTLRDGLQMPGIRAPAPPQRLKIATYLNDIGVDRLELFGTWYDVDRKTAQLILDAGFKARIAIWVRANKNDIDEALRLNGIKEVGISHPVSDIHLQNKLMITREEAFDRVTGAVKYATEHGLRVFYHGEDSTRSDMEYEKRIIQGVIEAGAEVYRICDTVGAGISAHHTAEIDLNKSIPDKTYMFSQNFKIGLEFHGHDDLGNAVTNSLTSLNNGAEWVSTTMLGVGERSGNAETEKLIMNLYHHYGVKRFDISLLTECCVLLNKYLNITIPKNKAIVGENAFTHQSGIHSDGVIKHPETYELFPPESVGNTRRLLIGSYSGKKIILFKLKQVLLEENSLEQFDENDGRVIAIIDYIQKNLFGSGVRHSPLTDEEFKELVRRFALI